ncbi:MAG TPA: O-antigen ligase [Longimicrobiaceae bacterium]|nr:O-antigen ligase [Longimicrobiaceae bacterium]
MSTARFTGGDLPRGGSFTGAAGTWPVAGVRPRPPRRVALERATRALLLHAETAFAVVGLLLFSQAVVPLLVETADPGNGGGDGYEGNMVLRLMFASIHATTLLLLLVHWRSAVAAALRERTAVLLVALAVASVLWSAAPDITLRRSFAFLGTTAFGIFLAARYDTRTLLRLLAVALGIAAVMSIGFAVALPSYGVDQGVHAGAWQGVYTEKNTLGQMMVLAAFAFVLLRPTLRRRWIGTAGALLSVALILLSTSKTALTVLVLFVLLAALFRALRWSYTLAIPVTIGFVLVGGSAALWLVGNLESALTSLGKDPTLTGRTPMWEVLLRSISESPWLGYGYAAFWLGREGPSGKALEAIGWDTPGAHNGYLDLTLQVGLVGLGVFLAGFVVALARSVHALRATRTPDGYWPLTFLTFLLVYNFAETMLLAANSVFWVLYVATACSGMLYLREGEGTAAAVAGDRSPVTLHRSHRRVVRR